MGIRQATAEELRHEGDPINLTEDFKDILGRGHVIDAFSSGGGARVVRIFESLESHDGDPVLGYGEDINIEDALRRARDTFRSREQKGAPAIDFQSGEYPEVGIGLLTGGPAGSPLDNLVNGGYGLKIHQDGDEIVAKTDYGRWAGPGLTVRGPDVQTATDLLVAELFASQS